jgi:hypothetical protein
MSYTYYPTTVEEIQSSNEEIGWRRTTVNDLNSLLKNPLQTIGDLKHRSNLASGDLRDSTRILYFKNFNFSNLPDTISGIELTVTARRSGRIVDEIVQLSVNNQLIGNNNFIYLTEREGHLRIDDVTTYGNPTDLWGIELTPELLNDSTFSVALKFQSHPYFPHSSNLIIESVALTVY